MCPRGTLGGGLLTWACCDCAHARLAPRRRGVFPAKLSLFTSHRCVYPLASASGVHARARGGTRCVHHSSGCSVALRTGSWCPRYSGGRLPSPPPVGAHRYMPRPCAGSHLPCGLRPPPPAPPYGETCPYLLLVSSVSLLTFPAPLPSYRVLACPRSPASGLVPLSPFPLPPLGRGATVFPCHMCPCLVNFFLHSFYTGVLHPFFTFVLCSMYVVGRVTGSCDIKQYTARCSNRRIRVRPFSGHIVS